ADAAVLRKHLRAGRSAADQAGRRGRPGPARARVSRNRDSGVANMIRIHPILAFPILLLAVSRSPADALPGTKPLTSEGDLAAQMGGGIDKYLVGEVAASVDKRKQYWKPDYSSAEAYSKSVQPNREKLKSILGVVDKRLPVTEVQFVSTSKQPLVIAQ